MSNSYKTAIHRTTPSAPLRWLDSQRVFDSIDSILDFGCGHGRDVLYLREAGKMVHGYDKYIKPWRTKSFLKYDIVLCTYVLNTIPDEIERQEIIQECRNYLVDNGRLLVTIRADKKVLQGYTTKGTWQGYVGEWCQNLGLKLLHKTSGWEIYHEG